MRNFLIKMLGGVSEEYHLNCMKVYGALCEDKMKECVEKHGMQNAWEQLKQEKQQARLH